MKNVIDFWNKLMDMIEEEGRQISPLGFDAWVKTIRPYDIIDNKLILSVPLEVNKEMIENRYFSLIKAAATILDNSITEVIIELTDNLSKYEIKEEIKEVKKEVDENLFYKSNVDFRNSL